MSKVGIRINNSPETLLDFSHCSDWLSIDTELNKLIDNRQFWGDAPFVIYFPELDITDQAVKHLYEITIQYNINISKIQLKTKKYKDLFKKYGFAVNVLEKEQPNKIPISDLDNSLPTNSYQKRTAYIVAEKSIAIRSGQEIKYNGDIIVIGDTNSGCQIYATGSIIIYGKLCGNVHAGWQVTDENKLNNTFIKALKMDEPLQVSIGGRSACSSASSSEQKKQRLYPETIRLINGQIWRMPDQSLIGD